LVWWYSIVSVFTAHKNYESPSQGTWKLYIIREKTFELRFVVDDNSSLMKSGDFKLKEKWKTRRNKIGSFLIYNVQPSKRLY
jgi:hypothetical protein